MPSPCLLLVCSSVMPMHRNCRQRPRTEMIELHVLCHTTCYTSAGTRGLYPLTCAKLHFVMPVSLTHLLLIMRGPSAGSVLPKSPPCTASIIEGDIQAGSCWNFLLRRPFTRVVPFLHASKISSLSSLQMVVSRSRHGSEFNIRGKNSP